MSKIVIVSHSTKGVEEYFRESTPPPFSIVFSTSQGHATQLLNLDYVHQLTPDAASSDCVSLANSVTATIPFSFIAGYALREFPFVGIIVCDHHQQPSPKYNIRKPINWIIFISLPLRAQLDCCPRCLVGRLVVAT